MDIKLPPLNALKAFASAARHLSFRRAADELNVTHSAISHQIKTLEDALSARLFDRNPRSVSLTKAGEVFSPIISDAFDRIGRGVQLVKEIDEPDVLTVQVYVTMALRWLIPRFPRFRREHPDIPVRLNTSYLDWTFDRGNVDVGIVIADKREPGVHYRHLFNEEIFPVCSATLLDGNTEIDNPEDLLRYPLLHIFPAPEDWSRWFTAAGVQARVPPPAATYDSFILALEAAMGGQGVALTNSMFVREDLRSGRLIRPSSISIPQHGEWCLACVDGMEEDPRVQRFHDWLIRELEEDPEVIL
jgi:LysR family glycine cleavage system transcriptional activator